MRAGGAPALCGARARGVVSQTTRARGHSGRHRSNQAGQNARRNAGGDAEGEGKKRIMSYKRGGRGALFY
eukprot:4893853-Pyramimonas_sp.AAC.1